MKPHRQSPALKDAIRTYRRLAGYCGLVARISEELNRRVAALTPEEFNEYVQATGMERGKRWKRSIRRNTQLP